MQPVLNIDDVKRVEVALTREGVSVSELMHRAGLAAAQEVLELGEIDNVVVLAGMGNMLHTTAIIIGICSAFTLFLAAKSKQTAPSVTRQTITVLQKKERGHGKLPQ